MYQCHKCGFSASFRMTPKKCPKCEAASSTEQPRWVRAFQFFSKPEDIGLGATIKRIAAKFGGERFKKLADKIGLPCGCADREIILNRQYPNKNYARNKA